MRLHVQQKHAFELRRRRAAAPPLVIGLRASLLLLLSQSHLGALTRTPLAPAPATVALAQHYVARRRANRPRAGGGQPPAQPPQPVV